MDYLSSNFPLKKDNRLKILQNWNFNAVGKGWCLLARKCGYDDLNTLYQVEICGSKGTILAAAYYYHGLILDEGNTEKSHGMAVAALQAAEEFLKESKKACEVFNMVPPTSRYPPLWGSMKYLSEKIPKDASSRVRINRDLYSQEKILQTAPALPDFALALKPDEYLLPQVDRLWNDEQVQSRC